MQEKTFIILKPDAIERKLIGEIISRFENKGYRILRIESRWKNAEWCRQHYPHIHDKIYQNLVSFMTSTSIIGIILEGPDAIHVIRNMVGITDSLEAKPGTIRGDFGNTPVHYNLVHAADSDHEAYREKELFYDDSTDYCPNHSTRCSITNGCCEGSQCLKG